MPSISLVDNLDESELDETFVLCLLRLPEKLI